MSILQNEKRPTGRLGISEKIHIDGVNGLKVITSLGVVDIERFVCDALIDHQTLIERFDPLIANDYPEPSYSLHKSLIRKEIEEERQGGEHG